LIATRSQHHSSLTATEGGANAELEVKDLKDTMGEGKHLDLEDNDPDNRNSVKTTTCSFII
jgi:hypothetical protein